MNDVIRMDYPQARKDFTKAMSDHVAFALVVYTLMLIFLVTPAIETKGISIFPYFLLVLLVGGIVSVFRRFEKRWTDRTEENGLPVNAETAEAMDDRMRRRFATDRVVLWVITLVIPILLSVIVHSAKMFF